ncbi:MAG: PGF-pre-PGF domain-containing protein, partial [Candidatus Methanoperedens sp.]
NNNMTGNGYNFYLYGWQDAHFNNSINTSNLVDGKPIYYIRNVSDAIYDSSTNAGTFYCILCNNVTIRNLTLTKNVIGVFFWNTNNSKVENISASLNRNAGIYLSSSNNNTLVNNNISSNNDYGISLSYSYNNTLTSNIASSNLGLGISIVSSSGNILSSNNASSNNAGIAMGYSSDNILTSNNASSNNIGIFIETSSNNTLTNNNMSSNRYNFALTGSENSHFNNSIPINNTVDGKPILYIENASDLIYDSSTNAGIFYCILCNNITVKDVVLTKNVWGVLLWNTNNSKIENITVTYNLYGITLASSNSNAISNTNSSFNDLGLLIALSSSNKLSNSTANSNSRYGIAIVSSTNNTITSAVISNSKTGIYISSSNDNVLHNTTSSNSDYGFSLKSSSNNTLTDNTALNNTFWDFSASDSVNNTVINLSINPTISFTGKDISIKSASSPTSAPSGYSGTGKYINATNNSADSWLFLNVSYTDSDVSNLNESSLRMWKHNGSSWAQVSGTNSVEPAQNYVYANITSFSIFALLGEPISTPPTSPGGGGSGGGGGGGTSSENYTNVESKEKYDLHIFKNNVTSYKFTHSDPILFVNITGNVNAGEITTLVEILKNTSYLVKTPAPGIVYKNVNIWVGTSGFAVPRNIKEAIITFRVKNSWLAENNIQAEEIFMLNRAGDAWNKLETKVTGMDDKYTYMESKGGAFPNFAISGIKGIAVATSTPVPAAMIETTTKTLAPTATASQPAADMGWAFALVGFMVSATAGYFFVIKKRLM